MRSLEREGVVLHSHLSVLDQPDARHGPADVHIEGRVQCALGVTVYVDKWLEARTRRDGRTEVRGVDYTYHAWRGAGSELRMLFRYDMSHGGLSQTARGVWTCAQQVPATLGTESL